MKDMFTTISNKIKNSKFMSVVSNFTSKFGIDSLKSKIDAYIDSYSSITAPTAFQVTCNKVAVWLSSLLGKMKNGKLGKILDILVRGVCIILSAAFIGCTLYVLCKLFIAILVISIIASAVAIGSELIICILNKAFGINA